MAWVWDEDAYEYVWQEDAPATNVGSGSDDNYSHEGNNYPAPVDYSHEGNNYPAPVDYSHEGNNYTTPDSTQGSGGSPVNATTVPPDIWNTLSSGVKDLFTSAAKKAFNYDPNKSWQDNLINAITSPGVIGGLGFAAGALFDKKDAFGGGDNKVPTQLGKPISVTQEAGKYGPIARFKQAADGGIMHAYAFGGAVRPFRMEDGGFVMTKRAVDGAGGPRGIQQLVPGARMIGGPPDPTGRRDRTPAVIVGKNGTAPAAVSRGEAYVPRRAVQQQPGGTQGLYALMNKLQRKA